MPSPPLAVPGPRGTSRDGNSGSTAMLHDTCMRIGGSSVGSALGQRTSLASSSLQFGDTGSRSSHGQETDAGAHGPAPRPPHHPQQQGSLSSGYDLPDSRHMGMTHMGMAGMPMLEAGPWEPQQARLRGGADALFHVGSSSSSTGQLWLGRTSADPLPFLNQGSAPPAASALGCRGSGGSNTSGRLARRWEGEEGEEELEEARWGDGSLGPGSLPRRPPALSTLPEAWGEGFGAALEEQAGSFP